MEHGVKTVRSLNQVMTEELKTPESKALWKILRRDADVGKAIQGVNRAIRNQSLTQKDRDALIEAVQVRLYQPSDEDLRIVTGYDLKRVRKTQVLTGIAGAMLFAGLGYLALHGMTALAPVLLLAPLLLLVQIFTNIPQSDRENQLKFFRVPQNDIVSVLFNIPPQKSNPELTEKKNNQASFRSELRTDHPKTAFDINALLADEQRGVFPLRVNRETIPEGDLRNFLEALDRLELDDVLVLGGAVRDTLLGAVPRDIDVAVRIHLPDDLKQDFERDVLHMKPDELDRKYFLRERARAPLMRLLKKMGFSFFDLNKEKRFLGQKFDVSFSTLAVGEHLVETNPRTMFTVDSVAVDRHGQIYQIRNAPSLRDLSERVIRKVRPGSMSRQIYSDRHVIKALRLQYQLGFKAASGEPQKIVMKPNPSRTVSSRNRGAEFLSLWRAVRIKLMAAYRHPEWRGVYWQDIRELVRKQMNKGSRLGHGKYLCKKIAEASKAIRESGGDVQGFWRDLIERGVLGLIPESEPELQRLKDLYSIRSEIRIEKLRWYKKDWLGPAPVEIPGRGQISHLEWIANRYERAYRIHAGQKGEIQLHRKGFQKPLLFCTVLLLKIGGRIRYAHSDFNNLAELKEMAEGISTLAETPLGNVQAVMAWGSHYQAMTTEQRAMLTRARSQILGVLRERIGDARVTVLSGEEETDQRIELLLHSRNGNVYFRVLPGNYAVIKDLKSGALNMDVRAELRRAVDRAAVPSQAARSEIRDRGRDEGGENVGRFKAAGAAKELPFTAISKIWTQFLDSTAWIRSPRSWMSLFNSSRTESIFLSSWSTLFSKLPTLFSKLPTLFSKLPTRFRVSRVTSSSDSMRLELSRTSSASESSLRSRLIWPSAITWMSKRSDSNMALASLAVNASLLFFSAALFFFIRFLPLVEIYFRGGGILLLAAVIVNIIIINIYMQKMKDNYFRVVPSLDGPALIHSFRCELRASHRERGPGRPTERTRESVITELKQIRALITNGIQAIPINMSRASGGRYTEQGIRDLLRDYEITREEVGMVRGTPGRVPLDKLQPIVHGVNRSEVRDALVNKSFRDLKFQVGVVLRADELVALSVMDLESRLEEILILLTQHRGLDIYLEGDLNQISNEKFERLLVKFSDRIHRPSDSAHFTKKKVIVRAWMDVDAATKETAEQISFDYEQAGALSAFLTLLESHPSAELLKDLGTAFIFRNQNGHWQVSENYLSEIWSEIQASYAVSWAA